MVVKRPLLMGIALGALLGTVTTWNRFAAAVLLVSIVTLFMPLPALMVLFFVAAMLTRVVWHFGVLSIRPDQILLLPLSIRLVFFLLSKTKSGQVTPRVSAYAMASVLLWFCLCVVSSFVLSSDVAASLRDVVWIGLSVWSGLVVYVAARVQMVGAGFLMDSFKWVVLLEVASGVGGYLYHLATHTALGVQLNPSTHQYQAYGTSVEANIFGSIAAIGLFLWLPTGRDERWYKYWASAICLAGVYLSLTRGVWLATVFAFLILVMSGRVRVKPIYLLLVALPLVAASALRTLVGRISFHAQDLVVRLTANVQAVSQWVQGGWSHWLLGFGVDSWGFTHFIFNYGVLQPAWLGTQIVQTLYDTGLLGLLFLSLAVSSLIYGLWHTRDDRATRLLGGILALAVTYQDTTALWFGFTWIYVGLCLVAIGRSQVGEVTQENQVESYRKPSGGCIGAVELGEVIRD